MNTKINFCFYKALKFYWEETVVKASLTGLPRGPTSGALKNLLTLLKMPIVPDENALIQKKILHTGTKTVDFRPGTRVAFHFVTKLCGEDAKILDDSRKMGKPMELVLGKKFKLEVWESVVPTMALNEVAQFTVDKSLLSAYPFVSKTLRDASKPKEMRKVPNHHCCSIAMQNEGLGYPDLNNLLQNPSNLEFTIELVKVESPEDYEKESWQMTEEEKLDEVPKLRERGNKLYQEKKYSEASQQYTLALGILEQLMLKEKPHDKEWLDLMKQKIPLLLNFSQCKLLDNDFYPVIEHCTAVLQSEPDNVKALFRRAKAHMGVWNPEEAQADFERVAELDSTLAGSVRKHLQQLAEKRKEKDAEDRSKLCGKLFPSS